MVDIQFNKSNFVILGAGGLGRELESWISNTDSFKKKFELIGYLDDNLCALNGIKNQYSVLGNFSDEQLKKYQYVLLGIAKPEVKEKFFEKIISHKIEIISFVHERAIIANNCEIDKGLVLCPFSIISCNTKIGKAVFVNLGSNIGHDAQIGDYTSLMANVDIGGNARIGKRVFIGSNAVILPNVKIADDVKIGAGSVVLRNIKEAGTYFGNPAKRIF
jgi:sugar O-acyltransferase (sialic acid O-acetyltransferase NeuD family)